MPKATNLVFYEKVAPFSNFAMLVSATENSFKPEQLTEELLTVGVW
jgi:hypothetical protein